MGLCFEFFDFLNGLKPIQIDKPPPYFWIHHFCINPIFKSGINEVPPNFELPPDLSGGSNKSKAIGFSQIYFLKGLFNF
ncbi:hypothetical protein [Parasediminibacterium sp. JCM 36343]|uniref:hypothetical protein n=1 Tax=Parasediminibacterium sp. JCM 36343 TaxID=3374279 RepID=UPI00397B704E